MVGRGIATAALLIAVGSSRAFASEADFAALERRLSGRLGVSCFEVGGGKRASYRADERFPMCSTFKLLAAAAVLKRVDGGSEKLDRVVPYDARRLLEYAPVTRAQVEEGGMKLGDLCAAAVEQSDNTAANLVVESLGGPSAVTRFARTLDDKITRLDRVEPEMNRVAPGEEHDTTSPAAMSQDLSRLMNSDVLSASSRELLLGWLVASQTGAGLIRAATPADWKVGDKTGRNATGTLNDVAVLFPPQGRAIIIAIYTVFPRASAEKRTSAVAEAARIALRDLRQ